jgi:anti-sigma factor RsiW
VRNEETLASERFLTERIVMKDVRNDELLRLSLKPALSPEEEARLEKILSVNPEARVTWEEERALSRAVQSLPDVPLSSNFTARVLQAVDLEEAREARTGSRPGWLRTLWPRLASAVAAVALAVLGLHELQVTKRERLAKEVEFVSNESGKLPSAEVLRDFDAIQQMRSASDDELLVVLQ